MSPSENFKALAPFRTDIREVLTDDVALITDENELPCFYDLRPNYLTLAVAQRAKGMVFGTSHRIEIGRMCSLNFPLVGHVIVAAKNYGPA